MSEKFFVYDTVPVNASKVEHYDHPIFGPVTVFKDVPIAREIVQQYDDGMAWKPANELEKAYWSADGRWAKVGAHPETTVLSSIEDINGRMVNPRFTKSLKDVETRRPMVRGNLVDLEVFDNKVAPDTLKDMLNGIRTDVSIGFFFDKDGTPGIIEEDGHPLNGSSYDYVQRNLMIDHLAFGLEKGMGRCPFPACGIGADRILGEDPEVTANYVRVPTGAECKVTATITISSSQGIKALYCGGEKKIRTYLFLKSKGWTMEKAKKWVSSHKDESLKSSIERVLCMEKAIGQIRDALSGLDVIVEMEGDYPSSEYSLATSCLCPECGYIIMESPTVSIEKPCSEYKCPQCGAQMVRRNSPESGEEIVEGGDSDWRELFDRLPDDVKSVIVDAGLCPDCDSGGDAGPRTEAERAMAHFNISEEEWEKLSDEEKQDYIDRLPKRKGEGEVEDESEADEVETDEVSLWVDEWIRQNIGEDAVLSYAQKKALPDSAYAYIESGCKKVDGKTEQRCRHLLIHDAAHVRAALAALSGARTGKVPSYASKAKGKVCAAAKKFGIKSEVCGTEKKKDTRTPEEVMSSFDRVLEDADLKRELKLG